MKLYQFVDELEGWIDKKDLQNDKISKSTIGWQIAHSLKVLNSVIKTLGNSDPKKYQWKFNFWRALLLPMGYFPRGKVKAPKAVRPEEKDLTAEEMKILIEKIRTRLGPCLKLPAKAYIEHPYFGMLHLKHTLRFLETHTLHHLKIIRAIAE